jgi:hypothetical protein
MQAVPVSPAAAAARFWMTRAGNGFLLGAAIATLEFAYYFPLVSERSEIGLNSLVSLLLVWGGECILLALAVGIAEYWVKPRELRARQLALAVVVGAFASALIWHTFTQFVLRDQLGVRLFNDHLGQPVIWPGLILYHAWLMLFFGGLAAAVQASQRQRVRMLAALRAAELGRATSQQRLAEARLASLQARIDPDFLLQALTRLERSYEADPEAADRLLDELIAFLREALADIRGKIRPERVSTMEDI